MPNVVELRDAYARRSVWSSTSLEGPRYRRIDHVRSLIESGRLGPDLRWVNGGRANAGMSIAHVETTCRSCGSTDLETIVEFGSTPLADQLLREDQLDAPRAPTYPLTAWWSAALRLMQMQRDRGSEGAVLQPITTPTSRRSAPALLAHSRAKTWRS